MRAVDADDLPWERGDGIDSKEIAPGYTLLRVREGGRLQAKIGEVFVVLRGRGRLAVADQTVLAVEGVALMVDEGETVLATPEGDRPFLCLWAKGAAPEPEHGTEPEPSGKDGNGALSPPDDGLAADPEERYEEALSATPDSGEGTPDEPTTQAREGGNVGPTWPPLSGSPLPRPLARRSRKEP